MIIDGNRYVITLDEPVLMPDSKFYTCIWGTCHVHKFEETFGFRPSGHASYFYTIGDAGIVAAGCRVNHAFLSPEPPINLMTNKVTGIDKDGKIIEVFYEVIYIADKI